MLATFKTLWDAATAENNNGAIMALMAAEHNANETVYVEKAASVSALESLSLGSICETAAFTESAAVQVWFAAKGYRW